MVDKGSAESVQNSVPSAHTANLWESHHSMLCGLPQLPQHRLSEQQSTGITRAGFG